MLPFAVNFGPSDDDLLKVGLFIVVCTVIIVFATALIVALVTRRPPLVRPKPTVCLDETVRRLWALRTQREDAASCRRTAA